MQFNQNLLRLFLTSAIALLLTAGTAGARTNTNTADSDWEPHRARLHQPLLEAITSFGAAVLDEHLYVFSGHDAEAHGFGADALVDHFRRIRLTDPAAEWEELAMTSPAQSTALVTDGRYLYRVGGLSFLNSGTNEETDFDSTRHFERYDPTTNEWTALEPMPKPRSSIDAAYLDGSIYVAGGWALQGESANDAEWYEDIWRFELAEPDKGWQSLEGPGYLTRAASVAAHDGKLYLIGGIQQRGITRKVSVFDPATTAWAEGPELPSDSRMAGFSTSSFATGGRLYATGNSGMVYRLSDAGDVWESTERLFFPRMFARLLPMSDDRLIVVGGTGGGRMAAVESHYVGDAISRPQDAQKSASWSVRFGGRAKNSQVVVRDGMKLYAIGGNASRKPHDFREEAFLDEAFVFDLSRQTAEQLAPLPRPLQSGGGALVRQTSEHSVVMVAGGLGFGDDHMEPVTDIFQLDTNLEEWQTAPVQLPEPLSMHAAAFHEDALWLFGGSTAVAPTLFSQGVLHWWADDSDVVPLPGVMTPTPRRSFGSAQVGNELYMIGGLADAGIAETIDVFNFDERSWRTLPAGPGARLFPSVVAVDDTVYVYGGFEKGGAHFIRSTSLDALDTKTGKWSTVATGIPGVVPSMKMLEMNGRLLFYGVDEIEDGVANFVLYDPTPLASPGEAEAMSFSSGGRQSAEFKRNAKALMRRDANRDGRLTAEELGKRMASFLERADADGDGAATYTETLAAIEAEAESAEGE
ncbi:MAG: kelch repeat-containing protein [Acidobacteriota bacterium]